jgi:hypothetical protein
VRPTFLGGTKTVEYRRHRPYGYPLITTVIARGQMSNVDKVEGTCGPTGDQAMTNYWADVDDNGGGQAP